MNGAGATRGTRRGERMRVPRRGAGRARGDAPAQRTGETLAPMPGSSSSTMLKLACAGGAVAPWV